MVIDLPAMRKAAEQHEEEQHQAALAQLATMKERRSEAQNRHARALRELGRQVDTQHRKEAAQEAWSARSKEYKARKRDAAAHSAFREMNMALAAADPEGYRNVAAEFMEWRRMHR